MNCYGVSPILSIEHPTHRDKELTDRLEETLRKYGVFESDSDLRHRMDVLKKLNTLYKNWIKEIIMSKNIPEDVADKVGGKLCTFGSFRLGVNSQGGDIDTLCIAPRHIDRLDFFTSFAEVLRAQPEVTKLLVIEEAFVPVIKLEFDNIELDMLFARLSYPTISDDLDLKDDSIFRNLDEKCVRSLNENGIYSNALGYLGGVSWAMLVARVCQFYPNAAASTLVEKFFFVYSEWVWPNSPNNPSGSSGLPVYLKPVPPYEEQLHLGFPVWDPRNNSDKNHLMPIITPAYPQQNSAFNVTYSTRAIMIDEIKRGAEICSQIKNEKAQWSVLFEPRNFFKRYNHFIVLIASTIVKEQYMDWVRMVESKIRLLIQVLEKNPFILLAHINPQGYEDTKEIVQNDGSKTLNYTTFWFIGLQFKPTGDSGPVDLDLTEPIQIFTDRVYMAAQKLNISRPSLDAKYVKRAHLENFLPQSILKLKPKKQLTKSDKQTTKRHTETSQTNDDDQLQSKKHKSVESANIVDESATYKSPSKIDQPIEVPSNHVTLLKNESKDSFLLYQNLTDPAVANQTTKADENNDLNKKNTFTLDSPKDVQIVDSK